MAGKSVTLKKPVLFSFNECLWFLSRGYDECLYRVTDDAVIRAVEIDGAIILFEITEVGEEIITKVLNITPGQQQLKQVGQYVNDWLDMDTNLQPFYDKLATVKPLAYMAKEFYGLRLIGMPDLFEALCWSIIGQQINLSFAFKLKRRMVEAYGRSVVYGGHTYYLFPEPARLAEITVAELKAMQFSESKAKYIINVASAFASGKLSKAYIQSLKGFETRQQALTQLKGIGTWTANYALMKSLREPQSVPHGDVGILNALANHGIIKERSEAAKIEKLFARFKGYETYLVTYLWRSLAVK